MSPARYYTTKEVAYYTGASLRQLQWWCEHNWIPVRVVGGDRIWSAADVERVKKIVQLRRAGVRHLEIRRLRLLERDFDEVVVVKKAMLIGRTLYLPKGRGEKKRA